MALAGTILLAVLLTSTLSGLLGMAGGMILMAVLTALVSVPAAMLLHGVAQASANGSRALILHHHVRWRVLPTYLAGAALALAGFAALRVIPEPGMVLLLVGLFALLRPGLDRLRPGLARAGLDVERPGPAFACGGIVTAAQLLAGASGPLLDMFYLNTRFTRHEIVATKALTQALGHLVKLGYYASVLTPGLPTAGLEGGLVLALVPIAVLGTRLGTRLLDRLSESHFRRASECVILAVGLGCVAAGVLELVAA